MKNYLIVILSILSIGSIFCQQTYKESKFFQESFSYKEGELIKVNGERTFVTIQSSEGNKVEANVEVISRYNDQSQAKADLEKMNVQFRKKGSTIFYSNALQINDPSSKPKSNLKTILHLKVPSYAQVEVINSYGGLSINGSIKYINVESKFCTTETNDFKGNFIINSKYGTIKCTNSVGKINAKGNRSDLMLSNTGGKIEADIKYGSVDITYSDGIELMKITSENAPITLIVPEKLSNGLGLQCDNCKIDTESCNNEIAQQRTDSSHNINIKGNKSKISSQNIKSKKGDIKIITTTTVSNSN